MASSLPASGTQFVLDLPALARLIAVLRESGYDVIGPVLRDNAILYDSLQSMDDLPRGWTADQDAGTYRLRRRSDDALFGYTVGPQGWKRFLHAPEVLLFEAQRHGRSFKFVSGLRPHEPYAFLGVRACELAAIAIEDRVLLGNSHCDAQYRSRRQRIFLAAVNCTVSDPTCFCASMHTMPPVEAGFDLALTELVSGERHIFVTEAASRAGAEVLVRVGAPEAGEEAIQEAHDQIREAVSRQTRRLDCAGLRAALNDAFESSYWDEIAARCLACGNCTQVCPTCFCTTVEDASDLSGTIARRWRRWDSCFSQNASYIHGGSVRLSARSRYRQWLMHKLATWVDQFGGCGCVGCGRCITWCPAAIDLTREAAQLTASAAATATR